MWPDPRLVPIEYLNEIVTCIQAMIPTIRADTMSDALSFIHAKALLPGRENVSGSLAVSYADGDLELVSLDTSMLDPFTSASVSCLSSCGAGLIPTGACIKRDTCKWTVMQV